MQRKELTPAQKASIAARRKRIQAKKQTTVHLGDCLDVLKALPDNSVDAIVTDPPYGLEFMGKDWDAPWKPSSVGRGTRVQDERAQEITPKGRRHTSAGPYLASRVDSTHVAGLPFQQWCQTWATECLRVLRPGGHMLAFGGTRTSHRLACAIEDSGFEIRDSIAWLYGSGFPKSLDVSKAIDKAAGAQREVVGRYQPPNGTTWNLENDTAHSEVGAVGHSSRSKSMTITAPATDAAKTWAGWGTALKPAHEPIIVARKPLQGTVANNVLQHGTGGLNIDACRVETTDNLNGGAYSVGTRGADLPGADRTSSDAGMFAADGGRLPGEYEQPAGRWPPNVVLDGEAADQLDRQSGTLSNCGGPKTTTHDTGMFGIGQPGHIYSDSGGASRFFPVFKYQAKAPARERVSHDGVNHPTVKPLALMRWLVRLVTPPGGIVLDPFAGSGTTGEAALLEGMRVILIENEPSYIPLIHKRLQRVKDSA